MDTKTMIEILKRFARESKQQFELWTLGDNWYVDFGEVNLEAAELDTVLALAIQRKFDGSYHKSTKKKKTT